MGFITGYSKQQRRDIKAAKESYWALKRSWINKFFENGFSLEESNQIFEKYTIHTHDNSVLCGNNCQPKDTLSFIVTIEKQLKEKDIQKRRAFVMSYLESKPEKSEEEKFNEWYSNLMNNKTKLETPKEVIVDQQVEVKQSTLVIETIEEQDLQIQLLELEQKQLLIEKQIVELKLKKQ